jgi:hypothetical protein
MLSGFQDSASFEEFFLVEPFVRLLEGFGNVTRNFFDTLEFADWAIQGFNQVVVDGFCDGDEVFFAHNDEEIIRGTNGSNDFFTGYRDLQENKIHAFF